MALSNSYSYLLIEKAPEFLTGAFFFYLYSLYLNN